MRNNTVAAELSADFTRELEKSGYRGELKTDLTTRLLYSTDASIYQIEPLGVAFPRLQDDIACLVQVASHFKLPVIPRGSGSGLAGQAIGRALIIDCSKYLTRLVDLNLEDKTAQAEPGLILSALNRLAGAHKLQFGPDPASADRATIGGCVANNAAGAHSIIYGMTSDHILSAQVVLSDGSEALFESISLGRAAQVAEGHSRLADIYRTCLDIRSRYEKQIRQNFPATWRRTSGYNLNYLLPWSPSKPPLWNHAKFECGFNDDYPPVLRGEINLAQLLAGSEGTLAIMQQVKLKLVPKPEHTVLVILGFEGIAESCDAVPEILRYQPSAIELLPHSLVALAQTIPAYASQTRFLDQLKVNNRQPQSYLVVEFSGDELPSLRDKARILSKTGILLDTPEMQRRAWAVRKAGLGILMSKPGDAKPLAFIEDTAVPVEKLAAYVREIEKLMAEHHTMAEIYAHASAGCLHIRPVLSLKSQEDVRALRTIAQKAVEITLSLKGSVSGEHGDGLARSEWIELAYGKSIGQAFCQLKDAADPDHLLNPGKIIDPPPMDRNLRYGPEYKAQTWQPVFRFQPETHVQPPIALQHAIELCNGAGVCRKLDGVMCPSFQASEDEMHSTRGRANLLRAMISGKFPSLTEAEQAVREALDLCLACKGCKSECPSGVDVARLKYEFFNYYYSKHGQRPLRDYLFGFIGSLAKLGAPFAPIVNSLLASPIFLQAGESLLGLSKQRKLPQFKRQTWGALRKKEKGTAVMGEKVLMLADAFTEYFYPENGAAALHVLSMAGCQAMILPILGAGRTLISKGFLLAAKRHGHRLVQLIKEYDPEGKLPVVGIEPSEIYTLKDELLDFFPDDEYLSALSKRSFTVEEFLLRPGIDSIPRIDKIAFKDDVSAKEVVWFHGHCYQKAQPPAADGFPVGAEASLKALLSAGYRAQLIESGCCGMAGAFGYEKEHYDFSMKVGEYALFPAIRQAVSQNPAAIIAASGVSCHAQISDGTGQESIHPVRLLAKKMVL